MSEHKTGGTGAFRLWDVLQGQRRLFLGVAGAAFLIAALVGVFQRSEWEAGAVVRVGQLGSVNQPIEPQMRIMERIKLGAFRTAVNAVLGEQTSMSKVAEASLFQSLSVRPVRGTELLRFFARGGDPEFLERFLSAVIRQIRQEHESIYRPFIESNERELTQIREDLDRNRESLQQLASASAKSAGKGSSVFPEASNLLMTALYQQHRMIGRELLERKAALVDILAAHHTFPTSIVDAVQVSKRSAVARIGLILGAGLVFGLFFGILAAMARNSFRTTSRP